MKALLMTLKCAKALDETWPKTFSDARKSEQDELAWSTLFLHLSDSVIRKIGDTETAAEL